jgi:hypothetical protein
MQHIELMRFHRFAPGFVKCAHVVAVSFCPSMSSIPQHYSIM